MLQIVIASRLSDGRVVFLARDSKPESVTWAALIDEAVVANAEPRAAELLALGEADAEARQGLVRVAYARLLHRARIAPHDTLHMGPG